ncbi:MAG TPA: response regulator [Bacteroidales bacterium]|nr:response regulator [Bacteroidales bacterium]
MNPLYLFLDRLTKKLGQHADLDVVNKIMVVYYGGITGIFFYVLFGLLALFSRSYTLSGILLGVAILFLLTLAYFHHTKRRRSAKIILTLLNAGVCLYLLHTGGTSGSGNLWLLLFPVFSFPFFGLSRGNLVSFLFFSLVIIYLVFQKSLQAMVVYPPEYSLRLMGAYSIIHLLGYMTEYIRFHNYQVMERAIIESKNETRQKEDFLSKLSHQIRTPLNNLTVVSNLVNKSKLDSEHRDLFDTILASTINLINVVNNIVKVSEVKIEKELSHQVNFDLSSSVDNTLKLFRDQHKDRLEVNLHASRNIKTNYIGDPIRIKQIFLNIIENIIKANPKGKILVNIEIDVVNDREHESELSFIIRCPELQLESDDYGNFYSRPSDELVREGSYQPDDYYIDFTIARKIIEYYGSELKVSGSDEQTTLTFGFLLKKGTAGVHRAEIDQETAQLLQTKQKIELSNANILLVEDNAINQKIIILSLKNQVRQIDVANNGKDALDKFGTTKYDLILMDIQMPVINGIVATKKIRELEATSNTQTPIIAITANALSGDKEACLAAGMNDYISKPFQVDVLVNKMKMLLEC